jgi:hypothetical protein
MFVAVWSALRNGIVRRVGAALVAGVVLAALGQLGFGAGHPAELTILGVGTATVTPSASADTPPSEARFTISGTVTGLYPGSLRPLVLTVSNRQAFAIAVTSITTVVASPNAACSAMNLSVASFSGRLIVPARSSASLTVIASLSHSAPNACQGSIFPLHYSGTAVKR